MEELLERLIKSGWKPFGDNRCTYHIEYNDYEIAFYRYDYRSDDDRYERIFNKSIRDLVSKESGLWQFCTENGMVKHEVYEELHSWAFTTADHTDFWYTSGDNYEYRIIQSALCDEDKLEDFILENVEIEG